MRLQRSHNEQAFLLQSDFQPSVVPHQGGQAPTTECDRKKKWVFEINALRWLPLREPMAKSAHTSQAVLHPRMAPVGRRANNTRILRTPTTGSTPYSTVLTRLCNFLPYAVLVRTGTSSTVRWYISTIPVALFTSTEFTLHAVGVHRSSCHSVADTSA